MTPKAVGMRDVGEGLSEARYAHSPMTITVTAVSRFT